VLRVDASHGDLVRVEERSGLALGFAFHSARSQIALRMLDRGEEWAGDGIWVARVDAALARRRGWIDPAGAFRAIFAESDGLPGLVVDVYGPHVAVQAQTLAAERFLPEILDALGARIEIESVLARNDAAARAMEGLPREVAPIRGAPPSTVAVREGETEYLVDLWRGQKTGAFLDQRSNRIRLGELSRGSVLDVFSYHGSFALHAAARAERVVAVDSSAEALSRAKASAARNGFTNLEVREANAFDELRERAARGEAWDVVVLDPPAFAKGRNEAEAARRGYKEINLRAMRLVAPGGILVSCSCSYHMSEAAFYGMLAEAAADARRAFRIAERRGASADHPERVGFPESRYLKCAVLVREVSLE
jgi:23S rRNA (cytosine1962-C5)-methyltransferase